MIIGHGIDLQEISRIELAYQKNISFIDKVLTENEKKKFNSFVSFQRKMEYLTGRWAAKEAFSKALGTGIGQLSFLDMEVLSDDNGAPILRQSVFSGKVHLSISHTASLAQASVILEDKI